ncbi:phage tail fiber protein [Thiobaca trueperi]|uniref:Uncharacterized protein n=1 Tax=Thiobaca trueperi TaxID=127458 RepID=A0A4R3MZB8_9GAMM|nr:hypothetical protein [Thiobaca trueperi]TCT21197.1 hypothetical protein EDC35_10450 [Thiobaca trueperi]
MISYFLADILTRYFRTAAITKPAGIYVALFTTLPTAAGTGGVEVSGGGYARVKAGPSDLDWGTFGNGVIYNAKDITFATPTADWGDSDIIGVGLYNALVNGQPLALAGLNRPLRVKAFDPPVKFGFAELMILVE